MNTSVFGISKNKCGFSLLEIIVAIALMVLVATMIVPRFTRKKKTIEEFVNSFNGLLARAYNSALMTGTVHRIMLDLDKDTISVEKATKEKTASNEEIFVPLAQEFRSSVLPIPVAFDIRNVYIEGKDEIGGTKTRKVWFFVVAQGLSQKVIINIFDEENERAYGLTLNPFTMQLKVYDEFQRPQS